MDKKTVDKIQNIIIVILSVGILGFMVNDYISRPNPEDQPALATADGLILVDTTLRKDMAAQADTFKSELAIRDTANDILNSRVDELEKKVEALEVLTGELEVLISELNERTQKKVAPETFAQFVVREYRGSDYVEVGSDDASVNHLVNVHNWDRAEVSVLDKKQRRRVHGASHTNKVNELRRQYNARYGLTP